MYVHEAHPDAATTVVFLHGGNVAGWMWDDQVAALPDHHCLAPDLPGSGQSADLDWTSLNDVADQLAVLIANRAHGGVAHVVGLSLGAVVGAVLTARHPHLVRSAMVTGGAYLGIHGVARAVGLLQLRCWDQRWYWQVQARAYGLTSEDAKLFVSSGLGTRRENAVAMVREVYDGLQPQVLEGLDGTSVPILALVGEREPRFFRLALADLAGRSGSVTARLVPAMHHVWNVRDPRKFNAVLEHWLLECRPHPELRPLERYHQ